jgi:hypothetical protein
VLVTNSTVTVTTTVSQQTTGISILGLSLTDWITACATVALALYAVVTIHEGRVARNLDEYEKELVNLFNPMADILSRAEDYTEPHIVTDDSGKSYIGQYQKLMMTDVKTLREIFVKYGHYLWGTYYPIIRDLLFFEKTLDSSWLIFPRDQRTAEMSGLYTHANWTECFVAIDLRRKQLIAECVKLRQGWLWRILHAGRDGKM